MKKQRKLRRYLRSRDEVMVADMGFKKQLWALDPELDLVWDPLGERWEIWRFPGQKKELYKTINEKSVHVASVMTANRSFREVGADILLKLQAGDTQKFSIKQLADYFDKMDDNLQRAKRKELFNKLDGIDREVKSWWSKFKTQVPDSYKVDIPTSKKIARAIGG